MRDVPPSAIPQIEIHVRAAEGDWEELSFRSFAYRLPTSLAKSPLTPRAAGNLEKAIISAMEGRRDAVRRAFINAISGTSDVPSLVKIAAAAHGEGFPDEARQVFQKAARLAWAKERTHYPEVVAVGETFGYAI